MNADRRQLQRAGRPAATLIEEAIALLRTAPAFTLVSYFIGAIPFWLGLLYFLSDMSRSADAEAHLVAASLGVALLFAWMKCWQCVFTSRLRAVLLDETEPPWTASRIARMTLAQAGTQTWGLPVRVVALLIGIPFGWVSSFYQSVTILGDGRPTDADAPTLFRRAVAQAKLWPGQMHSVILQLGVLGIFIWLNLVVLILFVPSLLKTFFGIDTIFTRSAWAFVNTTFFTATFALTMLCLDPLWRAVYVLRCFYGESLRTGRDLAVQLARVRNSALILVLGGWCAFAGIPAPIRAAESAPIAAPVDAAELDRRIADVLERREYTWRMPREKVAREKGWFDQWIEDVGKKLRGWVKAIGRKMDAVIQWIYDHFFKGPSEMDGASKPWGAGARISLWAALALSLAIIVWALLRALREKRATVVAAEAIPAIPDLTADDVAADELPEDGWLALAREHAARGDFALALRAMWLACLAHLGHRELLRIARHKSNRDYDLELRRRARTREELLAAFRENLIAFESAWYGRHQVTPDTFARFSGNLERIRGC